MAQHESSGQTRENAIDLVTEAEAPPEVADIYREIKASREGELDEDLSLGNMWLLYGNDADLLETVWDHMHWTYNGGSLPYELKSEISLVVATVIGCPGCQFFHESALERAGVDTETIASLEELEISETGFSPTEEVILRFAQKAAEDPHAITDEDLEALRDIGLTEPELLEIVDCIALHVYAAYLQGIAGIVYPGMSRDEWTQPAD